MPYLIRLPSAILMMRFMTPTSTCMAASHMVTPYQDLPLLLTTTGTILTTLVNTYDVPAYVTCMIVCIFLFLVLY